VPLGEVRADRLLLPTRAWLRELLCAPRARLRSSLLFSSPSLIGAGMGECRRAISETLPRQAPPIDHRFCDLSRHEYPPLRLVQRICPPQLDDREVIPGISVSSSLFSNFSL